MNKQTNDIGFVGSNAKTFSDQDGKQHQYFPISNEKSIELHSEYEERMALLLGKPKEISKFKKVYQYLKFELNNILQVKVAKKIYEQRKNFCAECPHRLKSPIDPIGFCKLCGCGTNPRAGLTVKLTVGGATCPLNKWQPVNTKFSFENIPETCIGICQTLWYNAKQLWQRN